MVFITPRRAFSASAWLMSGFTAAVTRPVTSSMLIRTLSSKSTHFISWPRDWAWKPFGEHVVLGRAQLLQRIGAHVVIGDDQSLGRHKCAAAAAIEPYRGPLQIGEPGFAGLEIIVLLKRLPGRVGEEPHSLVGGGADRRK
jgi:hypothetical protein